jgi:hypothetical protein
MSLHATIENPGVNLAHDCNVLSPPVMHINYIAGKGDWPESRSTCRQLLEVARVRGVREPGGTR